MATTLKALVLLLAGLQAVTATADTAMPQPVAERAAPADLPEGHPPWPVRAGFVAPTDRYPHKILGRIPGWGGLIIDLQLCKRCDMATHQTRIDLPENRVFEDIAPRLWDITGDGRPEIVVVESDAEQGVRLTAWEARAEDGGDASSVTLRATRALIGTRFRWLAPLGAADFTENGVAEIAYVETPHLNRVLRLMTLQGGDLVEIARLEGVINHAIGEEKIHGGIRQRGATPEIIALSVDREAILAIRLEGGDLVPRVLGPVGNDGIPGEALTCAE